MRREIIPSLLEIQELILQLRDYEKRLKNLELEFENYLNENLKLINDKEEELRKIIDDFKLIRDQQKEKEDKVVIYREKLSQEEKRSLTLKNPKEVMHIEKEIENLKKQINNLEDEILNLMIQSEEIDLRKKHVSLELQKMREEFENNKKILENEINLVKDEIRNLSDNISEKRSKIPEQDLIEFDNLLKSKNSRAIARVINKEICEGCRLSIPKAVLEKVKKGDIVNCPNCGRILWLE
uniref:C4-type zinc ribbon domain-containing protein n=1 Tax=Dictyoglomus thermophilum TaxID=14 RepID=A0A7C3RIU2_DICTH